jgi:hypothetical protein
MSKLIQHIEAAGKETPAPLGFSRKTRPPMAPSMVLLASCSNPQELKDFTLLPDGVLLCPKGSATALDPKVIERLVSLVGNIPWGVKMNAARVQEVPWLKEQGCDFVILESVQIPIEALQDNEIGRLLIVSTGLDKEEANTLEDLPLDVVICSESLPESLDLQSLINLSASRSQIGKPFLLSISKSLSVWELECLRGIGIDGFMLDLDQSDSQTFHLLRERILELPRRKSRGDHPTPYIPGTSSYLREAHQEPQPDEDEDEEF